MKFDLKEFKKITVLYIEDDETIREQTGTMFDKLFKKTYVAQDGVEGLELFKTYQNEIDIVVTDINVPGITGLEVIERIHTIKERFPSIVTSAYTDKKFLLKSLELNVCKYVPKPIKIKELALDILEAVKKYQKTDNLTKTAQALVNHKLVTEQEVSNLQDDIFLSEREINIQKDIINDYVSYLKIDKNGIILNASNKFCVVYEYKKDEVLNQNMNIICENMSSVQKKLLEGIREKRVIEFTEIFTTKSGKNIELFCELYPLYENTDGLVSGYNLYQDAFIPK